MFSDNVKNWWVSVDFRRNWWSYLVRCYVVAIDAVLWLRFRCREKLSGFVNLFRFIVFQVFGFATSLQYTMTPIIAGFQIKLYLPLSVNICYICCCLVICRFRLLKWFDLPYFFIYHHSFICWKTKYTGRRRSHAKFVCLWIQSFYFFSQVQNFGIRLKTEIISFQIRRCVCKHAAT